MNEIIPPVKNSLIIGTYGSVKLTRNTIAKNVYTQTPKHKSQLKSSFQNSPFGCLGNFISKYIPTLPKHPNHNKLSGDKDI